MVVAVIDRRRALEERSVSLSMLWELHVSHVVAGSTLLPSIEGPTSTPALSNHSLNELPPFANE